MTNNYFRLILLGFIFSFLVLFPSKVNAQNFCSPANGIILVTNTADQGLGSLRAAIDCANFTPGPNVINFNISGSGPHIIFVGSTTGAPLPTLTDASTIIDGSTQPGSTVGLGVVLDGSQTAWNAPIDAILIENTNNCGVFGMTIRSFPDDAIDIENSDNCFIGAPGRGNVIYNNGAAQDVFPGFPGLWQGCGIVVKNGSDNNVIRSNTIGTNFSQSIVGGNEYCGIIVLGFSLNNQIGGAQSSEGNIIANNLEGIRIDNSFNNRIRKNQMFCNSNQGISFTTNGNNNKIPPAITVATTTQISGTGPSGDLVDVYLVDDASCQGVPCQGKIFLGTTSISLGNWQLFGPFANGFTPQAGMRITAISTSGNGSSSTFANCSTLIQGATTGSCASPSGIILVTNTNDSGSGSLRSAIDCANSVSGPNQIHFNIPGAGPHQIFVGSATGLELPPLLDAGTRIDGSTQPGFGIAGNYTPKIILNGSQNNWQTPIDALLLLGNTCSVFSLEILNFPDDGIDVTGGDFCRIGGPNRGNVIYNNGSAIDFFPGAPNTGPWNGCGIVMKGGASFTVVQGNYIGTNYNQSIIGGNEYCGVIVQNNCVQNRIGGNGAGEANVIANNQVGVRISATSSGCRIQRNIMYCNSIVGIQLTGGNLSKAAPTIINATTGFVSGVAGPNDVVEVFANNDLLCPGAPCQGRIYLGVTQADGNGVWTLAAPFVNNYILSNVESYTATATDPNNNTSPFANCFQLSNCGGFAASTIITANATCGFNNGGLVVITDGGTGPYAYNIGDGNQGSEFFGALSPGNYNITVTDISGCATVVNTTIAIQSGFTTNIQNVSDENCGLSDGSFTVTHTGGSTPFTYTIGSGATNNPSFTNLSSGTYTVTISDANGCTATQTATLGNTNVVLNVSSVQNATCGMSNGSISFSANGTAPYTFDIGNGGVSNNVISGLSAGTYTVTVTDGNGCTDSQTVTLSGGSTLVSSFSNVQDENCGQSDGTFTVNASGGNSPYLFDIGNGSTANNVFSSLSAGSYNVVVTDADGCTNSQPITLSAGTLPTINFTNVQDENCGQSDGGFTVDVVGGNAPYSFNIGNGNVANNVFSNINAGVYSVAVSDANGCTDVQTITLNGNGGPTFSITNIIAESCGQFNGGFTIVPTGGTSPYTYDDGSGASPNPQFVNIGSGAYNVVVTDANGCSFSQIVTVDEVNIEVAVQSSSNANCGATNGSATIATNFGTAPFTYDIGNGANANNVISGLNGGNYVVTVTDTNGCTGTTSFTITSSDSPTFTVANMVDATCGQNSGGFTIVPSGGISPYTFNDGSGSTTNPQFTNLNAGAYNVEITDANGCTNTQVVTINSSGGISIIISNTVNETCGQSDGSFTITPTGTAPFTYDIGNGAISNNVISGLASSSYTVTATDANGCTTTETVSIGGAGGPQIVSGDVVPADCGQSNGAISITVNGGTPSYTYDAGTGTTNNNVITNLLAGMYNVTVTDANGCTDVIAVTVNDMGNVPTAGFLYSDNGMTVSFSNTSTNVNSYFWDFGDGQTSTLISPTHIYNTAGTYNACLTVTNNCGTDTRCEEFTLVGSGSDPLVLEIGELTGVAGETIQVPVIVQNFEDIVLFQKSITLVDTSVAEFIGVSNLNLTFLNAGSFSVSSDTITSVWLDASGVGQTVANGTVIYTIDILLKNNISCSDIVIGSVPTPIQVVKKINGNDITIGSQIIDGEVCVIGSTNFPVNIAGEIAKENGQTIANVEINCTNAGSMMTVSDGLYDFSNMIYGNTYTVTPFKDDTPTNGVTGLDMVFIQQHILSTAFLDSPYKMIAADANNSGAITTLDLAAIQSIILSNTLQFPNNTSWRFIPKDFVFTDPTNPFLDDFPESITLTNLTMDELDEDFVAIKVGDVNLNAIPFVAPDSNEDLAFVIGQPTMLTNDLIKLEVKAKDLNKIVAWQMDLSFDRDQLKFEGIENGGLPNFNITNTGDRFLEEGILPIVWINPSGGKEGLTMEDGTVLFSLKFRLVNDVKFSKNWLGINTNRIHKAAFRKEKPLNVKLLFEEKITNNPVAENWQVSKFSPNPFDEKTSIEFILPQKEKVWFSVFDLSGKKIYSKEWIEMDAGKNKIVLDGTFFPSSSVYYYRLRTSQNHAEGKIIFTK